MTAPTVNVVRALDDHADNALAELDAQIADMTQALHALYLKRAALQALRDMRQHFNGAAE